MAPKASMTPARSPGATLRDLLRKFLGQWASEKVDSLLEASEVFSGSTAESAGRELGRQHRRQERIQAFQNALLARLEANQEPGHVGANPKDRASCSQPDTPSPQSPERNPQNGSF